MPFGRRSRAYGRRPWHGLAGVGLPWLTSGSGWSVRLLVLILPPCVSVQWARALLILSLVKSGVKCVCL